MSTTIVASYRGDPSLGATLFLEVRNPADGSVLYARANTGVREDRPTCYTRQLTLATDLAAYATYWDVSGGTPDFEIVSPQTANTSTAPIVLPSGGVSPVVSQVFRIKRGDNEPLIFPITELDVNGSAVVQDVTGWTGSFKLRATPDTGTIILNHAFYISDFSGNVTTDGTLGLLAYDWGRQAVRVGETDREGVFVAEFECLRADGVKKTYPTTASETFPGEYIQVHFLPDLDDAGSH